ncbi:Uma2 family endonuclease [Telmatobacter bradus]|uniref:Uma2 family endonuclease n=1 Tax=Telmatobacter bradus TaxID=474953 RepID=UPI003B433F73
MATMPASDYAEPLMTVEEYLATSYRPDCDYVDGRVEERNVGEFDHGLLQALLGHIFISHCTEWGVRAVTDVRTQVKLTRYRCPDLSVLRSDAPREQILTHPPLIAIEILSPEDRLSRMQEWIDDYLAFGIENIWILDPATRHAWIADRFGLHLASSGELTVEGTPIRVELCALFAELDR